MTAVAMLVGAATLLLAGCGGGPPSGGGPGRAAANVGTTIPSPEISVDPSDRSSYVRLNAPVSVRARAGTLESVAVHANGDATPLAGRMATDRRSWTSSDLLDPDTHYVIESRAAGPDGGTTSSRTTFGTMNVGRLTADTSPGDGDTVGVGMPIRLRFNTDVPPEKQAALISHVTIASTPPTVGAWHWFSTRDVHWRPQEYWPSGTRVTITAGLRGVEAGANYWGLANWTSSFSIGEKHVSIIDTASHQMQVFQSDQLVQQWPISAGKPGRETLGGTLVVLYKRPDLLFDSRSIGIPRNSPDGYFQHVFSNTAISVNGFFVHAAPWSEALQGSANVSHGCVNLSPDRAKTFFEFSRAGDIVQVTNSPRAADYGDGEGDWQIPYAQFANSGSPAAPSAANAPGGV